jgi:hypothetical protein
MNTIPLITFDGNTQDAVDELIDDNVDAELRVAFRKLIKKDALTREKV